MKPRIFSGMQPSGNLHIGNYLGALKTWSEIQHDYEPIFCIVDQHAITEYQDPKTLQKKIEDVAALYIAAGIDPAHAAIFVQSMVPAHVELAWVFTCMTPFGWLGRMTQFKAKSEKKESFSTGLFCYPLLMAADILLYQAAIVPVGEDQAQHLELTRDIAERFNSLYGETFIVPETRLPAVGARVMGLDDPTQKMSKSAPGDNHAIGLLDPPARIKKLIARAVTDSKPAVDYEEMGAGVENLLAIFQAFSGWSKEQMRSHFEGMRYGEMKKNVTEMIVAKLEPIQRKYAELSAEKGAVRKILRQGAERVAPIAEATMRQVKERVGLYV
jgi:tryptophanyl-tRNA synthetase